MRKQFVNTVESLLSKNTKLVLLLGDIGVYGFRKSFELFPDRCYNIGILEQSTISLAAGLAITGLIPVVHTIAPFLVERCLEQLKDDFCYQKLGGNFVSVGGSYEYAAMGCTHHCPADIGLLKNLPGMEIVVPGTADEFNQLFCQSYKNGNPTYFRLSESQNFSSQKVKFGKANIIKKGKKATIIVVGPMLGKILEATIDLDVTVLYYTTLAPFDKNCLKNNLDSNKVIICEPYYVGALNYEVNSILKNSRYLIRNIGIERQFLLNYGTSEENDLKLGLDIKSIRKNIIRIINE